VKAADQPRKGRYGGSVLVDAHKGVELVDEPGSPS
jgi:hypothetical protein